METIMLDCAEALERWSFDVKGAPYGTGYRAYRDNLVASLEALPGTFRRELTRFTSGRDGCGALRMKGIRIPAGLPSTPHRPYSELREPIGTEAVLLAATELLGEVTAFPEWHAGDRVQNFYPLPEHASGQNANNSVYLELHTETAFRPNTPDIVALLCLRADPRVQTLLCDGLAAWAALDEATRALLTEPAYGFMKPDGGRTPGKALVTRTLRGCRLNYAEALVAEDSEHQRALDAFHAALLERLEPVVLEAGDLVLLDNTRLVHGRSPVQSRYDGGDRWIQRTLGLQPRRGERRGR